MKEGWEYKKLGEVCEIFGRIGFRGYKREDYVESEKEGAISLSPSNIIGGHLDYSKSTYISWYKYEESPEIKIFEGDVLLVKTASVGKSAIVGTLPHAATINPQFVVFKNIQTDNQYLFYSINSKGFLAQLKSITSGSSVPTLSQKALAELTIPLPPLPLQKSIVAELDEINNLLSLKRKELETYDKLAQSLFYEMFGDPVENEKGWEVKKLGDMCELITDGSHFSPKSFENGVYPMLSVKDMDCNGFNYTDCKYISCEDYQTLLSNGCKPLINDVLVAKDGSYLKTAFVQKEDKEQAILSSIAIIRPKHNLINSEFLAAFFRTSEAKETVEKYFLTGTAIKRIILKGFRSFQVYLPPLPLQQLFASRIEAIEAQKTQVKAAIEKLERLLAARMQYWFD